MSTNRDKAIVSAAEAYISEEKSWEDKDTAFRGSSVSVPDEKKTEWEIELTAHILRSLDLRDKLAKAVAQ